MQNWLSYCNITATAPQRKKGNGRDFKTLRLLYHHWSNHTTIVQNHVITNHCLEIKTVADSQRLDYAEITKAILKDFQWSSESVLLRKLNHYVQLNLHPICCQVFSFTLLQLPAVCLGFLALLRAAQVDR